MEEGNGHEVRGAMRGHNHVNLMDCTLSGMSATGGFGEESKVSQALTGTGPWDGPSSASTHTGPDLWCLNNYAT